MNLPLKLLTPTAKVPTRAHPDDAGLDLYADSITSLSEGVLQYGTGVAVAIPPGYVGFVLARSSIRSTPQALTNAVGTIDKYTGEIFVTMDSPRGPGPAYTIGDRLAQLVVVPALHVTPAVVDELPQTARGANGHGSSGK